MKKILIAVTLMMFVLVTACVAQTAAPGGPVKSAAKAKEWRQLFNGRDMDGWQHLGPGSFVVEDGMLRTKGGMGLLWYTREKFGDCVIRVVYKGTHESSNSGVFVRIADKPKDEWFAVHHGYEVQILDAQNEYHRTGAVYSLGKAAGGASKPPGEWNTMEITLKGDLVSVSLNGTKINDFDPKQTPPERTKEWEPERGPRPPSGYIGLQNHDDYERSTRTSVYFKEVSVRPL